MVATLGQRLAEKQSDHELRQAARRRSARAFAPQAIVAHVKIVDVSRVHRCGKVRQVMNDGVRRGMANRLDERVRVEHVAHDGMHLNTLDLERTRM